MGKAYFERFLDRDLVVHHSRLPKKVRLARPHTVVAQERTTLDAATWTGRPNRLSDEHHPWPVLDVVHEACERADVPEPVAARFA